MPNHADRSIAGGPTFNLIANSYDLARDFEAGTERTLWGRIVYSGPHHEVCEVQAGGLHAQMDVRWAKFCKGDFTLDEHIG